MNVKELLPLLHLDKREVNVEDFDFNIVAITQDTRKVSSGSCFVCISGSEFDGHQFVEDAVSKGASLIISERNIKSTVPVLQVSDTKKALAQLSVLFYGDPTEMLTMVGVTGTNGKTTITHLVSEVLTKTGHKTGIIGTMYNKIGDREIPTLNTTPDSLTQQQLYREMLDEEVDVCTMEVSSHGLVQGRVWGVDYDVAAFTNLSNDHLEYHHTMDNYFLAKSLLFSQLGNSYHHRDKTKTAVINIDDTYGEQLVPLTSANVLTYGCHGKGIIQGSNICITSQGTTFDLTVFNTTYPVSLKLIGDFNVYNTLAAFGICYALKIESEIIITALEEVEGVRGRFEIVPNNRDITVIVDYAHTPDGLENVLSTINKFKTKDVYCVVGCGGNRSKDKRPEMAQIAVDSSTYPVFTSDNPRKEEPQSIIDDMTINLKASQYVELVNRKDAINYALNNAKAGDVVLIAGKGHEDYQIIGTTKHHFDDVEVVIDFFGK